MGRRDGKPVLERIDQWVRNGGTLVFAPRPRGNPITVEGDASIVQRLASDTGKSRVIAWHAIWSIAIYAGFVAISC